jgi:hypothetical protein
LTNNSGHKNVSKENIACSTKVDNFKNNAFSYIKSKELQISDENEKCWKTIGKTKGKPNYNCKV